jgi:3'-5' exoribonuclease
MEQTTLTPTRCFVRDLADGQEVNEVFVVRTHTRRQRRNGDAFLKLQLGDMTGVVEAVVWDEVDALAPVCPTGSVVRILGRYSVDERYGAAITVKRMRAAAEHEYELGQLTEAPPVPYEQMAADLQALVDTIQRPHLRTLLGRLTDRRTEIGAAYHAAPAAKYYHQAYRHGLLEHCLSVAQGVSALAAGPFRTGLDRDLAVTGALLHDIGKTEVYAGANGAIELTDRGKVIV